MAISFAAVYQAVRERYRRRQDARPPREARRHAIERHRAEQAQLRAYIRMAEMLVREGVYFPPGARRWTVSEEPRRGDWYGTVHDPYPPPDHGRDWRGTVLDPYRSPDDVGR